jgi:hypothetical protein
VVTFVEIVGVVAVVAAVGVAGFALRQRINHQRITRAEAQRAVWEEALQRRVNAAPLQLMTPTGDGRNTFVRIRPTRGDTLPREAIDELERFIATLRAKEIRRTLKVEYRDGAWHVCKRGAEDSGEVPQLPSTKPNA